VAGFGRGRDRSHSPSASAVPAPQPQVPPVVKPPPPPPLTAFERARELASFYWGGGRGTRRPDLGELEALACTLTRAERASLLAFVPFAGGDTGVRCDAIRALLGRMDARE
jgi:hypothetical protein